MGLPGFITLPERLAYENLCSRAALPERDRVIEADCNGQGYLVTAQTVGTNGQTSQFTSGPFIAPFVLVRRYLNPSGFNRFYEANIRPASATDDSQDGSVLDTLFKDANGIQWTTFITNVQPVAPFVDCGPPIPVEPEPIPVPPAVTINIGPFNVELGDFNTTITVDASSRVWAPQLDINNQLNIPVEITIAPNLLFPGGTQFPALFLVGPNILNAAISFNPSLRIGRLALNFGGTFNEAEGGEGLTQDEVADAIRENIATKALKPPGDLVLLGTLPIGDSGTFTLPERARELRLTVFPNVLANRSQFGGENAEDLFYLGWVAFGATGLGTGERVRLDYTSATFPIPLGSLSCLYSLTGGAEGSAQIWGDNDSD